jgi:hypothetical protein
VLCPIYLFSVVVVVVVSLFLCLFLCLFVSQSAKYALCEPRDALFFSSKSCIKFTYILWSKSASNVIGKFFPKICLLNLELMFFVFIIQYLLTTNKIHVGKRRYLLLYITQILFYRSHGCGDNCSCVGRTYN